MEERASKSLQDQIETQLVFVRMLLGEPYEIDFVEDPTAKPEVNLSALELNLANLLSIREPLSSSVQTMEASWEEWSALIKKINVNGEREAEVAAYRAYSTTSNLKDTSASASGRLYSITKNVNILEKIKRDLKLKVLPVLPAAQGGTGAPARIKLPSIDPQKFHGDPLLWRSFWGTFENSIHRNTDIADVDKFAYLLSYLSDDAKDQVKGLTVSSANYTIAVNILKAKYDRRDRIIEVLDQKLLALKAANSFSETKKLVNDFEIICKQYEAEGIDLSENSHINRMILVKLNRKVMEKLLMEKAIAGDDWNTAMLRSKLTTIVEQEELLELSFNFAHQKKEKEKSPKPSSSSPQRVTASSPQRAQQSDQSSDESPPETVGSVSASAHSLTGKEETVLFMCVQATVRSPTKSVKANIFLDSMSFRTFLTEELNDKLDLEPIGRDSMKICSFGSQNPEASTLNRVIFDVVTDFGDKISLTGNVKKFLTPPAPVSLVDKAEVQSIIDKRKSNLAIEWLRPDIVIGMDNFHFFCVRYSENLTERLILSNSKLGYIISGPIEISKVQGISSSILSSGFCSATPQIVNCITHVLPAVDEEKVEYNRASKVACKSNQACVQWMPNSIIEAFLNCHILIITKSAEISLCNQYRFLQISLKHKEESSTQTSLERSPLHSNEESWSGAYSANFSFTTLPTLKPHFFKDLWKYGQKRWSRDAKRDRVHNDSPEERQSSSAETPPRRKKPKRRTKKF
jgi:hypothetical protein